MSDFQIDIPAFKAAYEALLARGKWTADNMGTSNFKSLQYKYLSGDVEYGTRVYFYKSYSALMSASASIFNKAQDVVVVNNMSDDYDGPCLLVKGWLDTSQANDDNTIDAVFVSSYLDQIFAYESDSQGFMYRNEHDITGTNDIFTIGTDIAKFCILTINWDDDDGNEGSASVDDLFFMLEQQMVFYNNIGLGPYYYRSAHIPIEFYIQPCTYGTNTYNDYTYIRDGNEIANELWEAEYFDTSDLFDELANSMLPDFLEAHPGIPPAPNVWSNELRYEFLSLVQAEVDKQTADMPSIYTDPTGQFLTMTYAATSTESDIIEPKIIQSGMDTPFGDLYTEEGISLEFELTQYAMAKLYQAYVLITNYENLYTEPEQPEDSLLVLHTVNGVRPFKFGNVVAPAVETQSFVTINGTAPFKVTQ